MEFNVTNSTTISDILMSDCTLQTVGSIVLICLFALSEAMPFLGETQKNNGVLQLLWQIGKFLLKNRVQESSAEETKSAV